MIHRLCILYNSLWVHVIKCAGDWPCARLYMSIVEIDLFV